MGHLRNNLRKIDFPGHPTTPNDRAIYLLAAAESSSAPSEQLLLQALCEGLGANCAGIAVLDKQEQQFRTRSFHSKEVLSPPEPFAVERSPAQKLLEPGTTEVRICDGLRASYPDYSAHLGDHGPVAFWAVPLPPHRNGPPQHLFVSSDRALPRGTEPGRSLLQLVTRRLADPSATETAVLQAEYETTLRKLHGYHQLTSAITDYLLYIDRDFRLQAANAAYITAVGRSRRDLIGSPLRSFCNLVHFDNRIRPLLERVLDGDALQKQAWLDLDDRGSARFYDARWDPIRDQTGEIIGVAAVLRDITERKHYRDSIRALSRHVSVQSGDFQHFCSTATALFADRSAPTSVAIWRRVGEGGTLRCIDHFDPELMRHSSRPECDIDTTIRYLAHFDNQTVVASRTEDKHSLLPPARRRQLARQEIATILEAPIRVGGHLEGFVSLERRRATEPWPSELGAALVELADLAARSLINEERIEVENQIQQSQKIESLGALAGGVAHDFNNLLVGVLGAAELAIEGLEENAPARQYIELIQQSSERATALCRQMLAYSGRGALHTEQVDLSLLVGETTDILRSSLPRNVDLTCDLFRKPTGIEVDATQIRQVVMNLITNAADASRSEGGSVSVRTALWKGSLHSLPNLVLRPDQEAEAYAFVEVEDNGCGMDEETLTKMFDPFFTTKVTGRGLGLAAALGIVRSHQGAIAISTVPGQGTTIRVYLPHQEVGHESFTTTPTSTEALRWEGQILIVDDDPAVGRVAAAMLRRAGLRPTVVTDGHVAIERFKSRSFDAVLLDLTMPGMGGEEVGRRLQRIAPEIPIILSTGFGDSEALGEELAQFKYFLPKPYTQAGLEKALSEIELKAKAVAPA